MARINDLKEAQAIAQALRDGAVPEENREALETALREFATRPQDVAPDPAGTAEKMGFDFSGMLDLTPAEGLSGTLGRDMPVGPLGLSRADRAELRGDAPLGSPENPDRAFFLNAAAEAGVDINTGGGLSDRGRAALLSFDPDAQMAALDFSVRERIKQAGIDLPAEAPVIFKDPTTNESVYLRPTPDGKLKPTLINPAGMDSGDFIELSAELPSIVLETGGAVVGGIGGSAAAGPGAGTVVGAAGGAGTGAAIAMPLRKKLAAMLGVPEEIAENANISMADIAFASGGELGVGAFMGAVRKFNNLGRPLKESDLPRLKEQYEKNLATVNELEEKLGGDITLTPTLGELTGDAQLLVAEAELRKLARGKAASAAAARDVQLKQNSGIAMRKLADSNGIRTADEIRPLEDVSQEVRANVRQPVDATEIQKTQIQSRVDEVADTLQDAPDMKVFTDIRDGTVEAISRAERESKQAWDALREAVGFNPETRLSDIALDNPAGSPIRKTMEEITKNGQGALLESLQQAQLKLARDAGFEVNEELVGLAQKSLDFNQLHQALSHYKRRMRQAARGNDPDGFRVEDIRRVVTAIEEQIANGQIRRRTGQAVSADKQAQVRLLFDDANSATRRAYEQYDTQNIKLLTDANYVKDPETGRFVYKANAPGGIIRREMFRPEDARFLTESLEAIGNDPRAKAALAEELMKKYRDEVFKDGVPQAALHNDFLAKYSDHMNILLGEGRAAQVTNLGSFARQLDQYTRDVRRLEADLQSSFGRRIADPTQPLNIAAEVLSERVTPAQARRLLNRLDRFDTELGEQTRTHIIEKMFHDSVSKTDVINSNVMGDMLRRNEATLDAVFGRQYTSDLKKLQSVMKMIDNRSLAKAPPQEVQEWWLQLTRSVWGPLSRKQRFTTALNRVNRRMMGRKAAELMQDPSNLRAFIQLSKMSPTDPRFKALVAGLGLAGFIDEQTLSTAERAERTRFELATENPLFGPNNGVL